MPIKDFDAQQADVSRQSFLLALAGFAIFSFGDGITKSTAGLWPGLAVAALRFGLAAAGLGVILLIREGASGFSMPRPLVQIGRGLMMTCSTGCMFMALQLMPLATATAIGFTTPLLTALLSALLLREHIPLRLWASISVALFGVLLVLRPSFVSLGGLALLPLGSALAMAFLLLLNRLASNGSTALLSQFLVALLAAPMLAVVAFVGHLSGEPILHVGAPSWSLIARIMLLATIATAGHWLVYLATVRNSAATVAPAHYGQIVVAVAIGWIVFAEMPDAVTFAGIALIIGAGLWLLKSPPVRR